MKDVIDLMKGLTFIDDKKEVILILPTKKLDKKYPLYLYNLTKDVFVSTLFIKEYRDNKVVFIYDYFNLDEEKKIYYWVSYNAETHIWEIKRMKEEELKEVQLTMIKERRSKTNGIVRKYIQV